MKLITVKDLANLLAVKQSTLYSWVHNDSIPFCKLNGVLRFDLDEIETWVKSSKRTPGNSPTFKPASSKHINVDSIVKTAIASVKSPAYNGIERETSLNQGPKGKEGSNGAL